MSITFRSTQLFLVLVFSALLSACGGGSSSGSSSVNAGSASLPGQGNGGSALKQAGIYSASSSNCCNIVFTVLPSGEYYGAATNGQGLYGLLHGTATSTSATQLSSNNLTFYNTQGANGGTLTGGGTLNASFPSTTTDTFTVQVGSTATTLTGSGQAGYGLNGSGVSIYSNPLSMSSLAGSYTGTMGSVGLGLSYGQGGLQISSAGVLTTTIGNCSATGNLTPVSTGASAYTVSLTAGGSACGATGTVLSGLLTPFQIVPETGSLYGVGLALMMMNSTASQAVVYWVSK